MRALLAAACVVATVLVAPAVAGEAPLLVPPVDAPVERGFEAPSTPYGPGNRGIDYAVSPGLRVRAAAAGVVTFAGPVAGRGVVTIDHGGRVETTYTGLRRVDVRAGDLVSARDWIGETGPSLHFGLRIDGGYVDPAPHLVASDTATAVHLVPLRGWGGAGRCPEARALTGAPPRVAPNDNVAVLIAGINSRRVPGNRHELEGLARALGYPAGRTVAFSYSPRSRSYRPEDTLGDVRVAASHLDALLQRIGRRFPGAEVDILAHSMGGIVARRYLQGVTSTLPGRPPVEHLVTFSTPHLGAPLASAALRLRSRRLGELLLDLIFGGPDLPVPPDVLLGSTLLWRRALRSTVPDPRSPAVAQLAPGSRLLSDLARDDLPFGTRALSLAARWDLVVPASRARLRGAPFRVTHGAPDPRAHSEIHTAERSLALAHAFLRDARMPCAGPSERAGISTGRAIGLAQELAGWAAAEGLDSLPPFKLRLLRGAARVLGRVFGKLPRLFSRLPRGSSGLS